MKHIFWVFLFLFFINCEQQNNPPFLSPQSGILDSIDHYYAQGIDKSFSRQEKVKAMNKAFRLSEQHMIDSLIIKSLMEKTKYHGQMKELDSALHYSRFILLAAQRLDDTLALARGFYKMGLYNRWSKQLDSAYFYYNECRKQYEMMNDSIKTGGVMRSMATILADNADYFESDQTALRALSFLKNTEENETKASIYNCLAISAKSRQEYDESLYWYQKALDHSSDKANMAKFKNNMANAYRMKGDYGEAIQIFEELIEEPKVREKESEYNRVYDNLNYTRWLENRDLNLEREFFKALEVREKNNNRRGQVSSHAHLYKYYSESDRNLASEHALKMYDLTVQLSHIPDQLEALGYLMEISADNSERYKLYSRRYIYLKDSVQEAHSKLHNRFAKIRYDSEVNRTENALLKADKVETALDLERSKRRNQVYLSLGILSIISFTFIYFYLRSRHQRDRLAEVYNTEARISKKVHDEVANDLYQVMTQVQNQEMRKEQVVDDLDRIYSKTRDISREGNALDLEQDFAVLLNDLLTGYKSADLKIVTKGIKTTPWLRIDQQRKITLYRVVQELMTNLKKHSKASMVFVSIENKGTSLQLKYKDNGVGATLEKRSGLKNVENRIHALNGAINFTSEPGKGLEVLIRM